MAGVGPFLPEGEEGEGVGVLHQGVVGVEEVEAGVEGLLQLMLGRALMDWKVIQL